MVDWFLNLPQWGQIALGIASIIAAIPLLPSVLGLAVILTVILLVAAAFVLVGIVVIPVFLIIVIIEWVKG